MTSSAFERTSVSQMRSASSPELGCETSRSSRFTPSLRAYCGSSACSTSMNAARPPRFCAWAMTVSVSVVFAGGFRAEDLDDAAAGKTADAERAIDQDVARGDDLDVDDLVVAETHDRAVAVVLGDLLDGEIEILVAGGCDLVDSRFFFGFCGHKERSPY